MSVAVTEEDPVAWFRRRTHAGRRTDRPAARADFDHLEQFVQSRRGVEAFIEPQTTVTETTVLLIAHDGEWTRRRVRQRRGRPAGRNRVGIPVYDVRPGRLPAADARLQRAPQAAETCA